MTKKSKTPDERFILAAYETAQAAGDSETLLDRYEIGKKSGLNPKAVNAICKLLVQANFIKKVGETEIILTKNGESLALRLQTEA
jgi:predicted transcriptional regulator